MKKILLLVFPIILLSWCGQSKPAVDNTQNKTSISTWETKNEVNDTNVDSWNSILTSGSNEKETKEAMDIIEWLLK
jgi:hypothetical protein